MNIIFNINNYVSNQIIFMCKYFQKQRNGSFLSSLLGVKSLPLVYNSNFFFLNCHSFSEARLFTLSFLLSQTQMQTSVVDRVQPIYLWPFPSTNLGNLFRQQRAELCSHCTAVLPDISNSSWQRRSTLLTSQVEEVEVTIPKHCQKFLHG